MRYLFGSVRYALWAFGNLLRKLRRPPDYIVFILEGAYPELRAPNAGFLRKRLFPDRLSLQELGEQLEAVQQDPRVTGVILHLGGLKLSAAQVQTVRGFITRLRWSGKRVISWSSSYDNTRYYIALAADEILLQTGGDDRWVLARSLRDVTLWSLYSHLSDTVPLEEFEDTDGLESIAERFRACAAFGHEQLDVSIEEVLAS